MIKWLILGLYTAMASYLVGVGLNLQLLVYFMNVSWEGYCETALLRSLTRAFTARQCSLTDGLEFSFLCACMPLDKKGMIKN